jgi:uncharacterized membrane protein
LFLSFFSPHLSKQVALVQGFPLRINTFGTILCYLLLTIGFYYFVVRENLSYPKTFLFGSFVYGMYELTNYSTLVRWAPETVVMDTLWGGVLFTITLWSLKQIQHRINKLYST